MASRLNPYINFDGDARAAMTFYESVFGGSLTLHTFGEMGGADQPGADKIMHAMLETPGGLTLMGADSPPGTEHKPGNNISVSLSGDDDVELRGYWDKLGDAGTIVMALEPQMWGDTFGMCADPHGITWMVNITSTPTT